MTDVNDVFGSSNFLKAEDLEGAELKLTISSVEIREYEEKGYKKRKPVLSFHGTDKKLVSNKTNSLMIAEHHGSSIEGWVNKEIIIFPTRVDFGGKMTDAIRVRPPAPKARSGGAKPSWLRGADEPPAELHDEI